MMTLKEMLDVAEGAVGKILLGTKNELVTAWIIFCEGKEITIALTPWSDAGELRAIFEVMAERMRELKAVGYVMASEFWQTVQDNPFDGRPPPPDWRPDVMPSEDPVRTEGVLLHACTKAEHQIRSLETKRDSEGRCASLTVHTREGDEANWRGRITRNLLKEGEMQ